MILMERKALFFEYFLGQTFCIVFITPSKGSLELSLQIMETYSYKKSWGPWDDEHVSLFTFLEVQTTNNLLCSWKQLKLKMAKSQKLRWNPIQKGWSSKNETPKTILVECCVFFSPQGGEGCLRLSWSRRHEILGAEMQGQSWIPKKICRNGVFFCQVLSRKCLQILKGNLMLRRVYLLWQEKNTLLTWWNMMEQHGRSWMFIAILPCLPGRYTSPTWTGHPPHSLYTPCINWKNENDSSWKLV